MSEDASAAGRKTEPAARYEKIAHGLQKNFEECNDILDNLAANSRRHGGWSDQDFRNVALFLRASAQLASVMARVESIKNRGSNTK